jgi:methyl-accepting chemotaxis protein
MPVRRQVLLAPALALCGILVVGWLAVNSLLAAGDRTAALADAAEMTSLKQSLGHAVLGAQGGMFRALSLQAAQVEERLVRAAADRSVASAGEAASLMPQFVERAAAFEPAMAPDLAALSDALAAFRRALDEVRHYLDIDPFLATMGMTDVALRSDNLIQRLDGISNRLDRQIGDRFAAARAAATDASRNLAIGVAAAVLIALMLCGVVVRSIGALLRDAAAAVDAGAGAEAPIPHLERRDEIGAVARAVSLFRAQQREREVLRAQQDAERAGRIARAESLAAALASFEARTASTLSGVVEAVRQLEGTAATLETAARGGQTTAQAVAGASTGAAENVGTVAAAAEQLAASTREIAAQIQASAAAALQASQGAAGTDAIVAELLVDSQQISDVLRLIGEIAGQTNLLALNATIEAARAGEAGRGFAVVAGEVKQLASQTASATTQISQRIAAMQAQTNRAAEAIREFAKTVSVLSDRAHQVAAATEQQAAATHEITRAIAVASVRTREVTDHAGEVAVRAAETDAAARDVRAASAELSAQAQGMKAEVDTLLVHVRAA